MNENMFELMGITFDGKIIDSPEIELLFGLYGRQNFLYNIPLNKLNYSIYLKDPSIIDSSVMLKKIDVLAELGIINKQISKDGSSELISITDTGYFILRTYDRTVAYLKDDLRYASKQERKMAKTLRRRRRNFIIEENEDPKLKELTKLHSAIENVEIDLAKQLVEEGADVNFVREYDQATPLSLALLIMDVDLIKYLLSKGADLEKKNKYGRTLLNEICCDNYLRLENRYRKNGWNTINEKINKLSTHKASVVLLKKINTLIELGADINTLDNNYLTPLCNAFYEGVDPSIIKCLIEHGAKLDKELYYGLLNVKDFSSEYKTILYENKEKLVN